MVLLFLSACITPGTTTLPDPLSGDVPQIAAVRWACDTERSEWLFTIQADAWTGGGTAWIARDADRYEEHRVRSVKAAADGSSDTLELELDVVADWRDASPGSSTAWRCSDAASLTFQVAINEISGNDQADCRTWGADPELWSAFDRVDACETLLTITDTGTGER